MRQFGVERIVLANELVDPAAVRWAAEELGTRPKLRALLPRRLGRRLSQAHDRRARRRARSSDAGPRRARRTERPDGLPHARGGRARSRLAVADSMVLELAGVEAFEGIVHGDDVADLARVDELPRPAARAPHELAGAGYFDGRDEAVLTVGGSAYFDRVVRSSLARPTPGRASCCEAAATSPTTRAMYDQRLAARRAGPDGERPSAPRARGVGRRPLAARAGPRAALHGQAGRRLRHRAAASAAAPTAGAACATSDGMYRLRPQRPARLPAPPRERTRSPSGDLVGCGISHPCTAFDKWRLIPVVDDDYTVDRRRAHLLLMAVEELASRCRRRR